MREDPRDHLRLLDARDHPQPSPAAAAVLDLDCEHPLQTLRPAQRGIASARRRFGALLRALPAPPRADGVIAARRRLCGANTP